MIRKLFCIFFAISVFCNSSAVVFAAESSSSSESINISLPTVHILPDNPLYFLKVIWEKVQLVFSRAPTKEASKLIDFSQKRLAEAQGVAESSGKIYQVEKLFDSYKDDLEAAQKDILEAKKQGEDTAEVVNDFRTTLEYQKGLLDKLNSTANAKPLEYQQRLKDISELLKSLENSEVLQESTPSVRIRKLLPEGILRPFVE